MPFALARPSVQDGRRGQREAPCRATRPASSSGVGVTYVSSGEEKINHFERQPRPRRARAGSHVHDLFYPLPFRRGTFPIYCYCKGGRLVAFVTRDGVLVLPILGTSPLIFYLPISLHSLALVFFFVRGRLPDQKEACIPAAGCHAVRTPALVAPSTVISQTDCTTDAKNVCKNNTKISHSNMTLGWLPAHASASAAAAAT